MKIRSKMLSIAVASVAVLAGALAYAQSNNPVPMVFVTSLGDIALPITPPNQQTNAPGQINNMSIGGAAQAPGAFSSLTVGSGTKTATAVSGAATLNKKSGIITTDSLNTASGGSCTLTLTNSALLATDNVQVTIGNGTNTAGSPDLVTSTVSAGQMVVVIQNIHASAALNGTLKVRFVTFEQ